MFSFVMWCTYISVACIFAYLWLKEEAVMILTVLLIIDVFTGVLKAIRIKEEVTSKKGILWPLSKLSILAIPFIVALMAKGSGWDGDILVSAFFGVASVYTGYSSIANIYMIYTGEKVTEVDATSAIIKYMLGVVEKKLKSIYPDR